jgi:hypothetical protein
MTLIIHNLQFQARIDEIPRKGLSEDEVELVGMVDVAKKRPQLGSGIDSFQSDSDERNSWARALRTVS